MELRRTTVDGRGVTVVAVAGDIDNATAGEVRDALLEAHRAGARVVVADLRTTDFLDSSALGALVGVQKQLQTDGAQLRIVCTKPHLCRVFEITRLADVIPVLDDLDAASRT